MSALNVSFSLKFAFIGSFVYPVGRTETKKPPIKVYVTELFEGLYETFGEVKDHIKELSDEYISEDEMCVAFERLCFFIRFACPFLADSEIWWAGTYKEIIEYAIDNECLLIRHDDTIWDALPKSFSEQSGRDVFSDEMPEKLNETICHSNYTPNFRR